MTVDRVETLAKRGIDRVADAAEDMVGDIRSRAKGRVDDAAGAVESVYGDARDGLDDFIDDVRGHFRDRPLLTIGVGVVIGLMLRSAVRRRRVDA